MLLLLQLINHLDLPAKVELDFIHVSYVIGGSKIKESVDQLLEGLRFDYPEKPRLVHRLDKVT
jgi:hypothetical protein